jgi:hypothetical protein
MGNVYVMTGNGGFNAKKNANDTNPGKIGDFNGGPISRKRSSSSNIKGPEQAKAG